MSELKVGDRVKVYGRGLNDRKYYDGKIGIVNGIKENILGIVITDEHYAMNFDYFHPKQCRKLVRVKKCKRCDGKGKIQYVTPAKQTAPDKFEYMASDIINCTLCNGKGKVKV